MTKCTKLLRFNSWYYNFVQSGTKASLKTKCASLVCAPIRDFQWKIINTFLLGRHKISRYVSCFNFLSSYVKRTLPALISSAFMLRVPFCHDKLYKRRRTGNWTGLSIPPRNYIFLSITVLFALLSSTLKWFGRLKILMLDICFVILILGN